MRLPPASIVTALRRQNDAWLERSLRSALGQTVRAEVVVVTADETPSSNLAVLHRLGSEVGDRLRVYRRPRPGFAVALNEAVRRARGNRIGLLHSDDWLAPEAIEASLDLDADIVSAGKQIWSEGDGGELQMQLEWIGSSRKYESLATIEQRARYLTHFLFLSRPLVIAVGGVDESLGDLSGVDDFELLWRMLEAGASAAFTSSSHYRVRDHRGDRLTLQPAADQLVTLARILDKHGVDSASRAEIIPDHVRWYGRTISDVLREDDEAS